MRFCNFFCRVPKAELSKSSARTWMAFGASVCWSMNLPSGSLFTAGCGGGFFSLFSHEWHWPILLSEALYVVMFCSRYSFCESEWGYKADRAGAGWPYYSWLMVGDVAVMAVSCVVNLCSVCSLIWMKNSWVFKIHRLVLVQCHLDEICSLMLSPPKCYLLRGIDSSRIIPKVFFFKS